MKRPPKNHTRLIADTAAFMEASYHTVFFCALAHGLPKDDQGLCNAEATNLLDQFGATNRTTEQVENFCLDVLTNRIPIFTKKGKQKLRKAA